MIWQHRDMLSARLPLGDFRRRKKQIGELPSPNFFLLRGTYVLTFALSTDNCVSRVRGGHVRISTGDITRDIISSCLHQAVIDYQSITA